MLMNIGMLEEAGTALVDVTNENIQWNYPVFHVLGGNWLELLF